MPRGKVLEYLGLTRDYRIKLKVKMLMFYYVKMLIDELPTDMEGTMKTPAAIHLFMTNQECKKLSEDKVQFCYDLVAKLLYLCK